MSGQQELQEYMIISKGQWDTDKTPDEIQQTIDAFYDWHARLVSAGKMKPGQRLAREAMMVSKHGVIDGPFAETKEVIGGYWFCMAHSLEEAAALAAQNPCIACGITFEVRPTDPDRCSAYNKTCETPAQARA